MTIKSLTYVGNYIFKTDFQMTVLNKKKQVKFEFVFTFQDYEHF